MSDIDTYVLVRTFGQKGSKKSDKVSVEKEPKANKGTPISKSPNAQQALNKKLSGLEKAQKDSAKTTILPDERVRYYDKERPSMKPGPTRGASFVTEHNPKTGQVKSWNECYDHDGNVIRVHPKTIDGQDIRGQHYPPTAKDLRLQQGETDNVY